MVGGAMTFYMVAKAQNAMLQGSSYVLLSPLASSPPPGGPKANQSYYHTAPEHRDSPKNPHRVPVAAH